MSQFTLTADPNSLNLSNITALVNAFNNLPGAAQYLNIPDLKGTTFYVTDNVDSNLVTKANKDLIHSFDSDGGVRALDQDKSSVKLFYFNPISPDDKPALNSLIHEIGHEKWPGLGSDAKMHDPLFYALLNNALHALGVPVDAQQDLRVRLRMPQ